MDIIHEIFEEHKRAIEESCNKLAGLIAIASANIIDTIKDGHKIFLFGNGGSAGDAQHIAAELTGRFIKERKSLPAIALTTDTSALTAIANDYGYDYVFKRQVEALAQPGDVLIGISTSGNSANVIAAMEEGKRIGCHLIGFSGRDGGLMNDICDVNIVVPSDTTARIQEIHILIGHIICEIIDSEY
jgi:D-sedoheptulose 7-phosphate isomerase